MVIFKLDDFTSCHCAGVAQPGQRRKTEALIPQGFVGSNPISRINRKYSNRIFSLCYNMERPCVFLNISCRMIYRRIWYDMYIGK